MSSSAHPIGIFDSGIGGLTVAHAVHDLLPNESFVYFGDTAHLPYGEKSVAAIQAYTIKICNFLLRRKCKVILIACNSASAAAFELAREYVASRARVLNVIDPVVQYLGQDFAGKRVGLIGTRATIRSEVYARKVADLHRQIHLQSLATPLLASMIEEGFLQNAVSQAVVETYLADERLRDIEALVLGCTHYPLIRPQIEAYYRTRHQRVQLIDGSRIVAAQLRDQLIADDLLSSEPKAERQFFVSDFTTSFEGAAELFFGEKINLQEYRLWE